MKEVLKLGVMFPINSLWYLMAPDSETAQLMKKPFVKFISHSSSYMIFLCKYNNNNKTFKNYLEIIILMIEKEFFDWFVAVSSFECCFSANGAIDLWVSGLSLDAGNVGRLEEAWTRLSARTHWDGHHHLCDKYKDGLHSPVSFILILLILHLPSRFDFRWTQDPLFGRIIWICPGYVERSRFHIANVLCNMDPLPGHGLVDSTCKNRIQSLN